MSHKNRDIEGDLFLPATSPQIHRADPLVVYLFRKWIGTTRRLGFLYLLFVSVLGIATWESFWLSLDNEKWYYYFFYFTNWTLTASTLYFWMGAFMVPYDYNFLLYDKDDPQKSTQNGTRKESEKLSILSRVRQDYAESIQSILKWKVGLLAISSTHGLLVTVVYWMAIYDSSRVNSGLNLYVQLNAHLITFGLIFLDSIVLTRYTFQLHHVVYPLGFIGIYAVFLHSLAYLTGRHLYPVLSGQEPLIFLVTCASFFLICGLQKIRNHIRRKKRIEPTKTM